MATDRRGGRGRFAPLTVGAIDRLTDQAVAITFDVPDELAQRYRFVQGQHVAVRARIDGAEVRRSYSICAPATDGRLRIAVKSVPGGTFSTWVHDRLDVGDELDVASPFGGFHTPLDPAASRHYAAIAAGSGITPVLSIVSTTLAVESASRFTVVYGNRTAREVMFAEELADLKDRYPDRLAVLHVLSGEQRDAPLLSGRIDRDRLDALLASVLPVEAVDEWFLCGPLGVLDAAKAALAGAGVGPDHVHTELFGAPEASPRPPVAPAQAPGEGTGAAMGAMLTLRLDGRRTTVRAASADETVLAAALRVRADTPFACTGGVCGTCRARVTAGEVRMDTTWALEPEERAAGYVLTCQSRPTTDHVTVDYDA